MYLCRENKKQLSNPCKGEINRNQREVRRSTAVAAAPRLHKQAAQQPAESHVMQPVGCARAWSFSEQTGCDSSSCSPAEELKLPMCCRASVAAVSETVPIPVLRKQ